MLDIDASVISHIWEAICSPMIAGKHERKLQLDTSQTFLLPGTSEHLMIMSKGLLGMSQYARYYP